MAVSPERMIQLSSAWRLSDGIPVILLPGRLTRWKGHKILIEALARLGRRDLRCVLVGDEQGRSGYRRDLDAHVARAGLADIVQIVGDCRDMAAAYMVADVVVSASTDPEAFGRVAAEAQAMGRPVIATYHGAARETVLADGVTGWLVPPGEPDALAAALGQALALTTSEREAMAKRAIAHVHEHFDKNAMCAKTMAVYNELMAGRRGDGQTGG
jgi:glycosyltransferase involved in cell wall biosynthesis